MIMQPIEDFDEEIVGDDDDYETGNGNDTDKYHIKLLLNLNFMIMAHCYFKILKHRKKGHI